MRPSNIFCCFLCQSRTLLLFVEGRRLSLGIIFPAILSRWRVRARTNPRKNPEEYLFSRKTHYGISSVPSTRSAPNKKTEKRRQEKRAYHRNRLTKRRTFFFLLRATLPGVSPRGPARFCLDFAEFSTCYYSRELRARCHRRRETTLRNY